MPFRFEQTDPGAMPEQLRPKVRENVDIGVPVIDLADMRRQLEQARERR